MSKQRTDKVTVLDRKIEVFQPVNEDCPYFIAVIEGFGVFFKGATPMLAHKAADTWRRRMWNNINAKTKRVPVDE